MYKITRGKITSCAFGGESLKDLYVTATKVELTEKELEEQPLAVSLFAVLHCGFNGVYAFEFTV